MPKRSFDGLDGICVGQQAVYQPQMKNKISERILLQNSSCDRAKEEKKKIETKTLNMLFSAQKKKGFYNLTIISTTIISILNYP